MVTRFAENLTDGHWMTAARDAHYRNFARNVVARHVTAERPVYEDRNVLEGIIIPFILSRFEPETVLDIGREPYESFYNEFFEGRELWTVDWNAERARFGAPNHIVDSAANLTSHFAEGYFDFVLMNGVFGWGLNERDAVERAFIAIHAVLNPRGIFVLGWNDTPDLVPVPLDEIQSLKRFTPYHFAPLGGTSFLCDTFRHTYSFYVK
jgi:SAM-dependent methyltransferase